LSVSWQLTIGSWQQAAGSWQLAIGTRMKNDTGSKM